jgi:hypothetical protein
MLGKVFSEPSLVWLLFTALKPQHCSTVVLILASYAGGWELNPGQVILYQDFFLVFCGLEVNLEKTKYMLVSHHQNAGQIWDIKTANRWFENLSGRTVTNQHLIQKEIKRGLSSGNAWCHSFQNHLSSAVEKCKN